MHLVMLVWSVNFDLVFSYVSRLISGLKFSRCSLILDSHDGLAKGHCTILQESPEEFTSSRLMIEDRLKMYGMRICKNYELSEQYQLVFLKVYVLTNILI